MFRISTAGALTVLYGFTQGYGPKSIRAGLDGHIYGATYYGGLSAASAQGSLFRMTLSGVFTQIRAFVPTEASDVWYPVTAPVQMADGSFYGAADGSNAVAPSASGAIYRMTMFDKPRRVGNLGNALGTYVTGLIPASNGTLVGTTLFGELPLPGEGLYGLGAAFEPRPFATDRAGPRIQHDSFSGSGGPTD